MEPKKKNSEQLQQGRHEHPLKQEISDEQRALNESAHEEAEKDMEGDPKFLHTVQMMTWTKVKQQD